MVYTPVKKRGNKGFRYGKKPPRRAGFRTGVAFDKNALKSNYTMQKYRNGFNLMWRLEGKYMRRIGMKKSGEYNKSNQHEGRMFSLPNEVSLSELQAGKLMRKCYKKGATKSQLNAIRKTLSYAFQLTTGQEGNFDAVETAWGSFDPRNFAEPTKRMMPKRVIHPSRLADAFTTQWTAACGIPFPAWCVGLMITWDWCVCGGRSGCDLEKLKNSTVHQVNAAEGWMRTRMKGGRSKLERKKGVRPWYTYRLCFCPQGKHVAIPDEFYESLDANNNPTEPATFCTTCPLNAFQFIKWGLPDNDTRLYPRWLEKQNRYSDESVGKKKLIPTSNRWLKAQGANPDDEPYCSNSGRKALGRWCDATNTPYRESFEIHGDLQDTWLKYYQKSLKNDRLSRQRNQSRQPEPCLKALRRFAKYCGRGTTEDDPENMDRKEKLLALLARKLGAEREVAEILLNS